MKDVNKGNQNGHNDPQPEHGQDNKGHNSDNGQHNGNKFKAAPSHGMFLWTKK